MMIVASYALLLPHLLPPFPLFSAPLPPAPPSIFYSRNGARARTQTWGTHHHRRHFRGYTLTCARLAIDAVTPQAATGGNDAGAGSESAPFSTIHRALAATRAATRADDGLAAPKAIVLQAGVHYLNATIQLGAADSGLTITAAPGAEGQVTVSGGVLLTPTWTKSARSSKQSAFTIYETPVPSTISEMRGLTTLNPHRRVTRAREPNADPTEGAELCTKCWHNGVANWHHDETCVGTAATVYKDLRACDDHSLLPDGQPCKNDSAMWNTYNTYSNGHGGCCAAWSGDGSPYGPMGNYFCGNSSAGGWVGYDDPRGDNKTQGLSAQLPQGFDFDPTDDNKAGPFLASMNNPAGAVMHVWRDQGWFVNMFEVESSDPAGSVKFAQTESYGVKHVKGGWQGGRGWQVNATALNEPNGVYLLAGKWMIENVWEVRDRKCRAGPSRTLARGCALEGTGSEVRYRTAARHQRARALSLARVPAPLLLLESILRC